MFDCVTSIHLPDNGQQKNVAACDLNELTSVGYEERRELYKFFLGKIKCEQFLAFDVLKDVVPEHSPYQFS